MARAFLAACHCDGEQCQCTSPSGERFHIQGTALFCSGVATIDDTPPRAPLDGARRSHSQHNDSNTMSNHQVVTAMQAAERGPQHARLVHAAISAARRCGATIDPLRPIDIDQLSREIAGASIDDRIRVKGMLHALRLIPA
jgi:hypothetical protein